MMLFTCETGTDPALCKLNLKLQIWLLVEQQSMMDGGCVCLYWHHVHIPMQRCQTLND
jgi:hypothetical protein